MNNFSEIYDYSYNLISDIVDDFIDKPYTKYNVDMFINLVIGFESYLSNGYHDVAHIVVNSVLYTVCKEKNCLSMWESYSIASETKDRSLTMVTQRNNTFHNRGELFMLSWILEIAESVNTLDELKEQLVKLKETKKHWITECMPGFTTSQLESKSIVTNRYHVTVKDNKYVLLKHFAPDKFNTIILWSEDTNVQCIIDIYGDDSVIDFVDSDESFQDNIAKLVNIANDWQVIEKPMAVIVTNDYHYNTYDL